MNLLGIDMSRLTVLFHSTRPQGQIYLPHAVQAISNRYTFVLFPKSVDEIVGNRLEMAQGLFEGSAIDKIEIYPDGMVISSRSDTNFIDRFFADITNFMAEEFGLSAIRTKTVDRIYDSSLMVESEKGLLHFLDGLATIGGMISSGLKHNSTLSLEYEPFGLMLAADQTTNSDLKPVPFRIERRVLSDYLFNQYISTAPLTTSQHMEVLNALELLI
jgi:hypothetical protein